MIQAPMVRVRATITNVRVESLGGLPHQPIVAQRVCIGAAVASRVRREASAAPRRITQEAASAISMPTTPKTLAQRVDSSNPVARPSTAMSGRAAPPRGAPARQLSRLQRLDHALGIHPRAAKQVPLLAARNRLDLAKAVQVPDLGGDVPDVGDDEVSRDELDKPADHRPQRARARRCARSLVPMPGQGLERLDGVSVRLGKQVQGEQAGGSTRSPGASRARAGSSPRSHRGTWLSRRRYPRAASAARSGCRSPRGALPAPAPRLRSRIGHPPRLTHDNASTSRWKNRRPVGS